MLFPKYFYGSFLAKHYYMLMSLFFLPDAEKTPEVHNLLKYRYFEQDATNAYSNLRRVFVETIED